jgi:hypothetical protein
MGKDLAQKLELLHVDVANYMSESSAISLKTYSAELPMLPKDALILATIRELGLEPGLFFSDDSENFPITSE